MDGSYILQLYLKNFTPVNSDILGDDISNCFMKVSPGGEVLWTRCYNIYGDNNSDNLLDMDLSNDGGIISSGAVIENDTAKVWVLKLDENGCYDAENCSDLHVLNHPELGFVAEPAVEFNDVLDGIFILTSKRDYAILPNPALDYVIFKFPFNEKLQQLCIFNSYSQLVAQVNLHPNSTEKKIDLNNFPSGVYIWKLGAENGRFVVQ